MSATGLKRDTILIPLRPTSKVPDPKLLKPLIEEITGTAAKENGIRANIRYAPSGNGVGTDGETPVLYFPGEKPDAQDETATVRFIWKTGTFPADGSPASVNEGFVARINAASEKAVATVMARLEEIGFTPDGLTKHVRGFVEALIAMATAKGSLSATDITNAAIEYDRPKAY